MFLFLLLFFFFLFFFHKQKPSTIFDKLPTPFWKKFLQQKIILFDIKLKTSIFHRSSTLVRQMQCRFYLCQGPVPGCNSGPSVSKLKRKRTQVSRCGVQRPAQGPGGVQVAKTLRCWILVWYFECKIIVFFSFFFFFSFHSWTRPPGSGPGPGPNRSCG